MRGKFIGFCRNMLETGEKTRDDTMQKVEFIGRKLNHIIERMNKKK